MPMMILESFHVYLIQSKVNGYVHVVFNTRRTAEAWMQKYERATNDTRHPYHIVAHQVYDSTADIN